MSVPSPKFIRLRFWRFAWSALLIVSAISGCYQQSIAPPLKYDQQDADLLSEELGQMDWE